MLRCVFAGILLATLALVIAVPARDKPALESQPRHPVALAVTHDRHWLFAANRRSGSVSVLDATSASVASEVRVGDALSDVAISPDGRTLLAVDEHAHELIVLSRRGADLEVVARVKVAPYPVSVRVTADGSRCVVASLWSHRVSVVELAPRPRVLTMIDLPFAPRHQVISPDGTRLIVTEAFGGRLGLINIGEGKLEGVRSIPGHNIRGLALGEDSKTLLLTHQVLNQNSPTTRDEIHWGNLLTNNLRTLSLANVLNPKADLLADSRLEYLGEPERGAGDPAGVAVVPGGTAVVALAGVGEVAIRISPAEYQRLPVGRRPTSVAASPDGHRAYVANTLSDSVSVINLKARKVQTTISLGPRPAPGLAELGEHLFFDARLSHDGWFSCHSCHTDGHTSGLLNDNLSDGTTGTPKRILSLLGSKDTQPWAWNGLMGDLETQIGNSVSRTMSGRRPSDDQVRALAAYLKTLPPPPSLDRLRGIHDAETVQRGRVVFKKQGCANCHSPDAFSSPKTFDVGLRDEADNRQFNPPSLRGISQGGPFFHDNRAATLEDVILRHRHPLMTELSREEVSDLLAFLRGL